MERRTTRVLGALAVAAAVTAALGVGFAAGDAVADPGDPVADMGQMHEETHSSQRGMGMGGHLADMETMDEMHWQMSARLSDEDRALHDRMHEACRLTNERTDS